jgi:hypothetical protein
MSGGGGPDEPVAPSGRPVGVRPAGQPGAPLRWADPGELVLDVTDRVVVREQDREWLADVAVAAARLVEWPPRDGLTRVVRLANPAEWPAAPTRAGLALLRSLDLPA